MERFPAHVHAHGSTNLRWCSLEEKFTLKAAPVLPSWAPRAICASLFSLTRLKPSRLELARSETGWFKSKKRWFRLPSDRELTKLQHSQQSSRQNTCSLKAATCAAHQSRGFCPGKLRQLIEAQLWQRIKPRMANLTQKQSGLHSPYFNPLWASFCRTFSWWSYREGQGLSLLQLFFARMAY